MVQQAFLQSQVQISEGCYPGKFVDLKQGCQTKKYQGIRKQNRMKGRLQFVLQKSTRQQIGFSQHKAANRSWLLARLTLKTVT